MKNRLVLWLFIVCISCYLVACTNQNQEDSLPETEELDLSEGETPKNTEVDEAENEEDDVIEEIETDQPMSDTTASINVYISNDDATAFISKEIIITTLSPEDVLNALVSEGVLTADVEILSFTTTEVEGVKSIDLNLSDSFASYVSGMGSTGEYYTIGSVCNTFLDAYGCEQIKITINGELLSTGHAEYPGYMKKFE